MVQETGVNPKSSNDKDSKNGIKGKVEQSRE